MRPSFRNLHNNLCFDDFTCLHAARTDPGLTYMTILITDGDLMDIRAEGPVRYPMRVADTSSCNGMLSAYFTNLRHL